MRIQRILILTFLGLIGLLSFSETQAAECEHDLCFRFPSDEPEQFFATTPKNPGPYYMDHRETEEKKLCVDYLGRSLGHCYPGHNGTDFMLVGGFRTMRREDTAIVATAGGEVVKVIDTNYDKCHVSVRNLPTSTISCGEDSDGDPRPIVSNEVILRHWNGRYYVYSAYFHLQTDSVPEWIKEALAAGETPWVDCGEPIGAVGSAGYSSAPHIHFEVRFYSEEDTEGTHWAQATPIDPFYGPYLDDDPIVRNFSMWTDQGNRYELPGTECGE